MQIISVTCKNQISFSIFFIKLQLFINPSKYPIHELEICYAIKCLHFTSRIFNNFRAEFEVKCDGFLAKHADG